MSNDGVIAVERALSILDCFKPGEEKLSLAEFAERLPLHKTTIFRLLNSLVRCNYAIRGNDGRYSPGPRLLFLGRVYQRSFDLSGAVMPVLEQLSRDTGESTAYYVEGAETGTRLCLFRAQPHEGLHPNVLAGSVMTPDDSATGRVFKKWVQLETLKDAPLPYFSSGVRDPYTSSWSVPIIGVEDLFSGALTLAGPSERLRTVDTRRFERILLKAASELSSRLGASKAFRQIMYDQA